MPVSFNIILGTIATTIRQGKEIKSIQTGKAKGKPSLFADNIILYVENPKDAASKLLELINKCSKVSEYKISIYISVTFIYPNNKFQKEH